MKIPYINLKSQHKQLKGEILEAISKVLENADFILGQEVTEFEKQIAKYCGTKYAIGVNSGTDALFLVMKSLEIGEKDEVITVPNSFLSTTSAIIATGAMPVFVDVKDDLNINPELIEEKITPKTKAILPVHLTGKPADMSPIIDIAQRHNLDVIEDAAQAIGAEYRGKRVGSFGVANCLSLHPLKTLNACGDAGAITTNDETIYNKLLRLRNIGLKNRNEADIWGYNSRLDTIQAAILNVKFRYLEEWIDKRRKNAEYYIEHLKGYVSLPCEEDYERCVYHTFIIQTEDRDRLQEYLLKNGVETKVHYPIPIHLQKAAVSLGYKEGDFPVAEAQSKEILSLPVYQELTQDKVEYIVETIVKCIAVQQLSVKLA